MSNARNNRSTATWDTILLTPMQACDIDEVMAIENHVYPYPWTRGNFLDALSHDYGAWLVRATLPATSTPPNHVLAYFVTMRILNEVHLLNIAVHHDLHGQGLGRILLNKIITLLGDQSMESILLEVRPSNQRAITLYEHLGFLPIGRRKNYYPAANNTREDAIVMRLMLEGNR